MRLRDDALTPVVSAAIALLIVTSTVGAVVIWGVPYTNDLRNKSTSENVKGQLDTLSKELNSLVNSNPGDKKIDTFSMDSGTISTSTKADRTVIMYSHSKDYEFTVTNIEGNNVFIRMIKPFGYPLNYNLSDARLSWSTCFLAGTKVLMVDGSYKNIEDITVGEQVASYSEYTNTIESGFVSNVFHHSSNEMPDYYIIINDGLKVTPNHRFYSDGKWVYAGDLKVGNHLFSSDGNKDYVIYYLERVFKKEPCFDLEIEQYHTYFVSIANDGVDVLVHNGGVAGANKPPTFGTPSPTNGSTNQNLALTWSIPISDLEGNTFKWFINCSNRQKSSATGASNGTKSLSLSGLSYSTTYRVYVNATDPAPGSGTWTRRWYQFTTKANQPPTFGTPSPTNGSTNQNLALTWSIPISDLEGNTFKWFINCSNGQKSSATGASNGTKSLSISGLTYSITYKVWVNSTDGYGWTRKWYTFTTEPAVKSITVISPNGGEELFLYSIQNITWSSVGINATSQVNIVLLDYVECPYFIAAVPNSGSYEWNLGELSGIDIPGYFKIVIMLGNWEIYDWSDNFFSINLPSITVISPNGGELWLANNTYNIIWTSQGYDGTITIVLRGKEWPGQYEIAMEISNTGLYQWTIPEFFNMHTGDHYKIFIIGPPCGPDSSDGNFSIRSAGTGVFTLNATKITSTSAKLNGELMDISGQIRFRYRIVGDQNWTYLFDWHGNYNSESFYESVYSLSPGLAYEYQAGVKNLEFEVWGNSEYFTTYLHEGFTNCYLVDTINIGGDNWSIDLSCLPSISGTVVIDLYTSQPSVVHFGTIWIYDSNSLIYMQSNNGESEGYAFEKGGILKYEDGKWHVEDTTQIGNWTNLFSIHVPQTIFSSFSGSASSNAVLKFKIYSSLQSSYTGESKQIYNMRIQFDGDHKYEWRDYLKGKYLFEDDTVPTEYPSLRYVPSENGICLALAYSTINLVLN